MSHDAAANPADTPFRPVTLEDLAQPDARDAAEALAGLLSILAPLDNPLLSTPEVMAGVAGLVRAHLLTLNNGTLELVFRLKSRLGDTFRLDKRSPLFPLFALASNEKWPLEIADSRLPRSVPHRSSRMVITVTEAAVILGGAFVIWRSTCSDRYVAARPLLPSLTDVQVGEAADQLLDPGLCADEADAQLQVEVANLFFFLETAWAATTDEGVADRRLMESTWRECAAAYAVVLGAEDLFRQLCDPDGVLLEAARERLRY